MKPEHVQLLEQARVIPVIQIENVEDALPLARTLLDNGLPVAEVTLRTEAALEAIAIIAMALPEMLLIAGTVLNPGSGGSGGRGGSSYCCVTGF